MAREWMGPGSRSYGPVPDDYPEHLKRRYEGNARADRRRRGVEDSDDERYARDRPKYQPAKTRQSKSKTAAKTASLKSAKASTTLPDRKTRFAAWTVEHVNTASTIDAELPCGRGAGVSAAEKARTLADTVERAKWNKGARGERIVASVIDSIPGWASGHDYVLTAKGAGNMDHVCKSRDSTRIYCIDTKNGGFDPHSTEGHKTFDKLSSFADAWAEQYKLRVSGTIVVMLEDTHMCPDIVDDVAVLSLPQLAELMVGDVMNCTHCKTTSTTSLFRALPYMPAGDTVKECAIACPKHFVRCGKCSRTMCTFSLDFEQFGITEKEIVGPDGILYYDNILEICEPGEYYCHDCLRVECVDCGETVDFNNSCDAGQRDGDDDAVGRLCRDCYRVCSDCATEITDHPDHHTKCADCFSSRKRMRYN